MNKKNILENNEILLKNHIVYLTGFSNLRNSSYISIKYSNDGVISIAPSSRKNANHVVELYSDKEHLLIKNFDVYTNFLRRNINSAKFEYIPNFYYSINKYPLLNPTKEESVSYYMAFTKEYLSRLTDSLYSYAFIYSNNADMREIHFCPIHSDLLNENYISNISDLYGDNVCSFPSAMFLKFYSPFFRNDYYETYTYKKETIKVISYKNMEYILSEIKVILSFLNPEFVIPMEMLSDFSFEIENLMNNNLDFKYIRVWFD